MSETIDAEIVSGDDTPELSQLDRIEVKLTWLHQKLDWAHNAVMQFGDNVDKHPMVKTPSWAACLRD